MKDLSPKILFMGTPMFAAKALEGLLAADYQIDAVITRPDTSKGRSGEKTASEVKIVAKSHGIPIFQPNNKHELTDIIHEITPELIVVAAYGMIVPQVVLDVPKYGALNIHGSLLPKYRGASPISEAILNGDSETGITIMKMSAGMDEGDIVTSFKFQVSNDATTASLTTELADLGAQAIVKTIPGWLSGELKSTPQNDKEATYCHKITKEDGHIDWNESAEIIERKVRAYTPWPTAYTFINEKRLKITKAGRIPGLRPGMTEIGVLCFEEGHIYVSTGEDTLEIMELQPEGKNIMKAADFINGNKQLDGTKLN